MGQIRLNVFLNNLFCVSLRTSMREYLPEAQWEFTAIDGIEKIDTKEALFLTICSHQFRIFIVIHFSINDCKEFISAGLNVGQDSVDETAAYDFLLEVSNTLCGMLKRDLGKAVPALGMSTPNVLERGSFEFINLFNINASHFQKVELNNQPLFYAGYYYCPNVEDEIQVEQVELETDTDSSELEFF